MSKFDDCATKLMSFDITPHVTAAGEHLGRVIRALYDGVAFRRDGQTFEVYSHEGDDIGVFSTADVNFAVCFMKRQGRQVGKLTVVGLNGLTANEPAFTFAWEGWLMDTAGR